MFKRATMLAAATFGLAAACASPALAARGMEVAVSDEDALVNGTGSDRTQAFEAARDLNATRMRIVVEWSRVSDADSSTPSATPDYDWKPIDDAIDIAAAYGMRTQLALAGPAPAYASGNRQPTTPVVRPNASRFADFARAAAEHFAGRVDRYSIWNEPNYPAWIAPKGSAPKIYRALYEAGYDAIKSADPRAQVLIGETVPYGGRSNGKQLGLAMAPLKFLRALACVDEDYKPVGHCTPLKADGYAHHPYEFTTAPTAGKFPGADNAPIQTLGHLRTALHALAKAGVLSDTKGRALPIYLTESGYLTRGKRRVAAAKRAKWLPQQFDVAARQPGVREMLQYNLFVPSNTPFTTGLLTGDGSPLTEFNTLRSWTRGAERRGLIKPNNGPIDLPPRPAEAPTPVPVPAPASNAGGA
jgi:hypothetical protein